MRTHVCTLATDNRAINFERFSTAPKYSLERMSFSNSHIRTHSYCHPGVFHSAGKILSDPPNASFIYIVHQHACTTCPYDDLCANMCAKLINIQIVPPPEYAHLHVSHSRPSPYASISREQHKHKHTSKQWRYHFEHYVALHTHFNLSQRHKARVYVFRDKEDKFAMHAKLVCLLCQTCSAETQQLFVVHTTYMVKFKLFNNTHFRTNTKPRFLSIFFIFVFACHLSIGLTEIGRISIWVSWARVKFMRSRFSYPQLSGHCDLRAKTIVLLLAKRILDTHVIECDRARSARQHWNPETQ